MARSKFYNRSRLNHSNKDALRKYQNFTHQKLVQEEAELEKNIRALSRRINQIADDHTNLKKENGRLSDEIYELEKELDEEEWKAKDTIGEKLELTKPKLEEKGKLRYLIAIIFSFPSAYVLGSNTNEVLYYYSIPGFILLYSILLNFLLEESDARILKNYNENSEKYYEKISKEYKPSKVFLDKKNYLENLKSDFEDINDKFKALIEEERSKKYEIVVQKKLLEDFKSLKRRAKETERTAKINAFEKKNRSGAQNIKDKLLKAVRIKSKWTCPYCSKASDVNAAEADHIHPVNKGGLTTMQNMVLICKKCNSKKTNLMLRVFCKKQGFVYDDVCERLERLGKDV